MANFSARMQKEFGPEFAARLEQTAQEAATKAEKATEKAVKQAEKAATRLRWQAGGDSWTSAHAGDQEQSSQKRKSTSKEQLQILQMVEKGIISPEEAATLLDALNN
jgi:phage/plasmid-associated DNA primase